MSKEDVKRQLKAWSRVFVNKEGGAQALVDFTFDFITKHEKQIREENPDSPALVWYENEKLRREIGL